MALRVGRKWGAFVVILLPCLMTFNLLIVHRIPLYDKKGSPETYGIQSSTLPPMPDQFEPVTNHSFGLTVYIRSAPNEGADRDLLRSSWLTQAPIYNVPCIFVVAYTHNTTLWDQLQKEARDHGDMLLFDHFVDSYRNLTRKTIGIFRYHLQRTIRVAHTHLVTANMDTLINVNRMVEFVAQVDENTLSGRVPPAIYGECSCIKGPCAGPGHRRQYSGKYAVSKDFMPDVKRWPNFCDGFTLLYRYDAVPRLLDLLEKLDEFTLKEMFLDDVLITGILRQKTNIWLQPAPFHGFYSSKQRQRCMDEDTCAVKHVHDIKKGLGEFNWKT